MLVQNSVNNIKRKPVHNFRCSCLWICLVAALVPSCIVSNRHIYTKHVSLRWKFQKLHLFQSTIPVILYSLLCSLASCLFQILSHFSTASSFCHHSEIINFFFFSCRWRSRSSHQLVVHDACFFPGTLIGRILLLFEQETTISSLFSVLYFFLFTSFQIA